MSGIGNPLELNLLAIMGEVARFCCSAKAVDIVPMTSDVCRLARSSFA